MLTLTLRHQIMIGAAVMIHAALTALSKHSVASAISR